FKHALVRDAAYEALLKSRRRELHRLVAHAIDEKFLTLKAAHPELLAHHWSAAGEVRLALQAWRNAGAAALQRRAFSEAKAAYQQALTLLFELPYSADRELDELPIQSALAHVFHITSGYVA